LAADKNLTKGNDFINSTFFHSQTFLLKRYLFRVVNIFSLISSQHIKLSFDWMRQKF